MIFNKFPTKQGEIIAHNWNVKIKNESDNQKSLDDLMHALINPEVTLQTAN